MSTSTSRQSTLYQGINTEPLEVLTDKPLSSPRPTPLLFVHGAWHGAWCWTEHFLPYFSAKGYACYALNLRGHGRSSIKGSVRFVRIADYVADVEEVAARIPAPPVLVGHSMGGFITQKYLERHHAPAGGSAGFPAAGGASKHSVKVGSA